MREINSALNDRIAESLAETGLTLPQMILVKALAHGGGLTVTDLAREMRSGKSTVVGIVDRLERAGLVERLRGGADRREVRVAFAEGAEDRIASIRGAVDACFASAFASLSDSRMEDLERSLETILGAVGSVEKNGKSAKGTKNKPGREGT